MKSNIYVLDTSVISARFTKDDLFHNRAREALAEIPSDALIIAPITVLIELDARSKSVKNWHAALKGNLDKLLDEVIEIDLEFLGVLRFINSKLGVKLKAIDLTVLTAALSNDAQLITFDEKLADAARFLGIEMLSSTS